MNTGPRTTLAGRWSGMRGHSLMRGGSPASHSNGNETLVYQVSPAARERVIANLVAWTADEPDANGCMIWQGRFSGRGYGCLTLWVDGRSRTIRPHRLAFHIAKGPIPAGLTLDHLCRNPACVNPEHLEPVTNRVNILRGTAPSSLNAAKTHCKRGHLLAGANLVPNSAGRICRECQRARQSSREYLDKQAARQRRYRVERRALNAAGEGVGQPLRRRRGQPRLLERRAEQSRSGRPDPAPPQG